MAEKEQSAPSFEQALDELESLVERMEAEDISLEDSLKLYERGVKLTQRCQDALKNAEQKVQILSGTDDQSTLEPFDESR